MARSRSKPGDPQRARDAQRIAAAARDAGVKRIDYLLITHFHADHDGGVVELAQLLPIGTFIDHGGCCPAPKHAWRARSTRSRRYAAVRAKGRHLEPKPGDRLPLKGVDRHRRERRGRHAAAAAAGCRRGESGVPAGSAARAGADRKPALDRLPSGVRPVPLSRRRRPDRRAAVRAGVPARSRRTGRRLSRRAPRRRRRRRAGDVRGVPAAGCDRQQRRRERRRA